MHSSDSPKLLAENFNCSLSGLCLISKGTKHHTILCLSKEAPRKKITGIYWLPKSSIFLNLGLFMAYATLPKSILPFPSHVCSIWAYLSRKLNLTIFFLFNISCYLQWVSCSLMLWELSSIILGWASLAAYLPLFF